MIGNIYNRILANLCRARIAGRDEQLGKTRAFGQRQRECVLAPAGADQQDINLASTGPRRRSLIGRIAAS